LNAKVNETSIGSTTSVGSADGSLASEISTLLRRSKDGGGVKCYNGENRKDYTGEGGEERSDNRRLERSDSIIPTTAITNNLVLVASLLTAARSSKLSM